MLVDELHGQIARELHGDTVGNGRGAVRGDELLFREAPGDGGRALGLHAVDLHAGIDELHRGGHAREQPAAARRDDNDVHIGQVGEDLQAERALAGDHIRIVIGMEELRALLLADAPRLGVGVVIAVPRQDDLRAVALGGLHLGDGGGLGHHDGRGDAEFLSRIGHALRVVAGGRGHDRAVFALLDERGDFVARAADLEGAGLLPVLVFEVDGAAGHGGEG